MATRSYRHRDTVECALQDPDVMESRSATRKWEAAIPTIRCEESCPSEELYDLESDLLETKNLAADAGASALLNRMRALLKKRLEETAYPGGFC